jgi:hypothetical protein
MLTEKEMDICRQWFNAVQDLNAGYLRPYDYALAEKLHQLLELRVPDSVGRVTAGVTPPSS